MGDSAGLLEEAVKEIGRLGDTEVLGRSAVYRTAPLGGVDQNDFLNMVVEVATELAPRPLLAALQDLERRLGRVRAERWGPRTMDIDIVWYDGLDIAEPDLEIPHPRVRERRFVLEPLSELAPELVLPGGSTVKQALQKVTTQRVERLG